MAKVEYRIHVMVDGLPPLQASTYGTRWAQRKNHRMWQERVGWELRRQNELLPPAPLSECTLLCVRWSANQPDYDNLVYSFKPLIDTLLPLSDRRPYGMGIILDDSPKVLTDTYEWCRARPRKGHVTMTVIGCP